MAIQNEPVGRRAKIALRQEAVMRLHVSGMGHRAIAKELGCSHGVVGSDIKKCVAAAKARAAEYADEFLHTATARYESLIVKAMADTNSVEAYVRHNAMRVVDQLQRSAAELNGWSRAKGVGLNVTSNGGPLQIVINELPAPAVEPVADTPESSNLELLPAVTDNGYQLPAPSLLTVNSDAPSLSTVESHGGTNG